MFERIRIPAALMAAFLLFPAPPSASAAEAEPPAASQPASPMSMTGGQAKSFVEDLAAKTFSVASDTSGAPGREERFRELFLSGLGFQEIGRFVLGRSVRSATQEQIEEFDRLHQETAILTWSRRFSNFSGESLSVGEASPVSGLSDGSSWSVDSELRRPRKAEPTSIRWRVLATPSGPRVVDVVVEGVSLIQAAREDYAAVLRASGGSFEAFLQAVRANLEKLKAG